VPIQYLLATSILKITEEEGINWKNINENNIKCLLNILKDNLLCIDSNNFEKSETRIVSQVMKETPQIKMSPLKRN
jgi:hypothetical protein